MKQPTVESPGSAIGDAVGISWLIRDIDGVRVVQHGGTTYGQYSEFVTIPERDFAIISMTNSGPNGHQFNEELVNWAFELGGILCIGLAAWKNWKGKRPVAPECRNFVWVRKPESAFRAK